MKARPKRNILKLTPDQLAVVWSQPGMTIKKRSELTKDELKELEKHDERR